MVISTGVSSVFSHHPDENRDLGRFCCGLVSGGCNEIPAFAGMTKKGPDTPV